MKKTLMVAAISVVLTACAGTNFKWADARQIKQGMTKSEVVQLVGKPTSVANVGDETIYVWVNVNGLTGKTKTLRINFDKNDRAVTTPTIPPEFID